MQVKTPLQAVPMKRTLELAAHRPTLAQGVDTSWPARPGQVRRRPDGRVDMMYISPGQWLICDPDDDLVEALLCASRASTLIDVSGKWCKYYLPGGKSPVLASALDVSGVLWDRHCTKVVLFDCPSILLAENEGHSIYVQRSFAASFEEAVARVANLIGNR